MPTSLADLRIQYLRGEADPLTTLDTFLARSNANPGHNTYLAQDFDWSRDQARALRRQDLPRQPLWGIPVSLKDCFDLTGFPTSCGSLYYRDHKPLPTADSTLAARLRAAGAVITGKTHLHQLAYGITGENADFGDCLQPSHPDRLTGGSSSGAAASLQEHSALAAIGTDTGGSIRVPAALCGLAGFRTSITLNTPALWLGGAHLAPSFDTLGFLCHRLADAPLLAHALFPIPPAPPPNLATLRIGVPQSDYLHDAEPEVLQSLQHWQTLFAERHATVSTFDAAPWHDAFSVLAPIQANEAAALHRGLFPHFEPAIAERLAWGASLTPHDLEPFRQRLAAIRRDTHALFRHFDLLLLPATPMASLPAHQDHSQTRARILRYTAPISLCGLPALTLPGPANLPGLQLVAPLRADATLLALTTHIPHP